MPKTQIPFFLKGKVFAPEGQVKSSGFSHLHWDRGAGMKRFLTGLPGNSYPRGSTPTPASQVSLHPLSSSFLSPTRLSCPPTQPPTRQTLLAPNRLPSSRTPHRPTITDPPACWSHQTSSVCPPCLRPLNKLRLTQFSVRFDKRGKGGGMGEEVKK